MDPEISNPPNKRTTRDSNLRIPGHQLLETDSSGSEDLPSDILLCSLGTQTDSHFLEEILQSKDHRIKQLEDQLNLANSQIKGLSLNSQLSASLTQATSPQKPVKQRDPQDSFETLEPKPDVKANKKLYILRPESRERPSTQENIRENNTKSGLPPVSALPAKLRHKITLRTKNTPQRRPTDILDDFLFLQQDQDSWNSFY